MRVFSREVNETLVIDGDTRVTVLEIGDDFVRLGIQRDRDDVSYYEEIVRTEQPLELEPLLN